MASNTTEWRRNNPDKAAALRKKEKENPFRKDRFRERYLKNKTKYKNLSRASSLKRKYGLEVKDYEDMLNKQNSKCLICEKPESRKDRSGNVAPLVVDHNHITGKIRGLLCHRCNVAIGHFDDSIHLLSRASHYLKGSL